MKENSLRSVLIVVMITSFITPFTGNAINIAIPAIAGEFHSTPVMLNMVVASYIIASAAFLLPFGRLGDIVGKKKSFCHRHGPIYHNIVPLCDSLFSAIVDSL